MRQILNILDAMSPKSIKEILKEISILAIKAGCLEFTSDQKKSLWIGFDPADLGQISAAERSLDVQLPDDYKNFLQVSNGFSAVNDTIDTGFVPVDHIDYLVNLNPEFVEIWSEHSYPELAHQLSRSILVSAVEYEQYFLLIPPKDGDEKWLYWKFASWIPGEQEFDGMENHFECLLELMKKQ